jgi:aspartate kinase
LGWRRHSLARIIGYAKLKTQNPKPKTPNSKPKTLLPMSIVVQKYGGSSVADAQKLKRVAERVMQTRASGHGVVVVVSAMGDTTDDLLALAKTISPNPDRRELDMLLSAGERISMALLSMAIRELGGDAISFTGSQSGIITNDRHVDARIIEVRPFRVQDDLAR